MLLVKCKNKYKDICKSTSGVFIKMKCKYWNICRVRTSLFPYFCQGGSRLFACLFVCLFVVTVLVSN